MEKKPKFEFAMVNGKFIPGGENHISLFNKANFFGYGVYESVKVLKGRAFMPKEHVERLFSSAKGIGMEIGFGREEVAQWINSFIKKNNIGEALLRIVALGETEGNPLEIFIFGLGLSFYPKKYYTQGVKAVTYGMERDFPNSKTLNMLPSFVALREAFSKGAFEALLYDREGNLVEGTRSNLFAVRGGAIFTAPADKVLEGVTKKAVVGLVKEAGFEVKERDIPVAKLGEYDELFITSTVCGVVPITTVDNGKINNGRPGPVAKELIGKFREFSKC